jgi:hypothetical protein
MPEYVDQVARKERFLIEQPDATITAHPKELPHRYWNGQVPLSPNVTGQGGVQPKRLDPAQAGTCPPDTPNRISKPHRGFRQGQRHEKWITTGLAE